MDSPTRSRPRRARSLAIIVAALSAVLALSALIAPAAGAATSDDPPDGGYYSPRNCAGWDGVGNNIGSSVLGVVVPPILYPAELQTPTLDGNVVRADGQVRFMSVGSCMAQVAFKMQTKVCGAWGCNWVTRNNGEWQYLWEHASEGVVSGDSAMTCRSGTHSYRLRMEVIGPATVVEEPKRGGKGGAIGVSGTASSDKAEDGPAVKITC